MQYNNNQYVYLEMNIKEMIKWEVNFDDVELEDIEYKKNANILIYNNIYGETKDFKNINKSVRILITDYETINYDKFYRIPEHIEYIIVDREIYNKKDEFEMMYFMDKATLKEYIEENIEKDDMYDRISENNTTMLYYACLKKLDNVALRLIKKMDKKSINRCDKNGETVLNLAIYNRMEEVAIELIKRMSDDMINKMDNYDQSAIYYACYRNMEKVALILLPRINKNVINKEVNNKSLLYYACENNMEEVAIEIIKKMNENIIYKTIKEFDELHH